jgi:tetratricopeptide (TPR) repeat protein
MGFLDILRQKEADPELQALVKAAEASKDDPEPYVTLALAYVQQFATPPSWNQAYAQKAIKAFRKATAIARKHAPSREEELQNRFIVTVHGVSTAYLGSHTEAQPDLERLEAAIWLLEQIEPDAQIQPSLASMIRSSLADCWLAVVTWREVRLESESSGEKELKVYLAAVERAMSFYDADNPMRNAIDYDAASAQLMIGARCLERAQESAVFGRKDGKLLNVEDSEHKKHARQAIQLLREGRSRLEPYTASEEYAERMDAVNGGLAIAYSILYNLTLAHSKYAQSIDVLKEAVQVVTEDADLWSMLGSAYEELADETIDDYNRTRIRGATGLVDSTFAQIEFKRAEAKVNDLRKKALECHQSAHQLAPDRY